MESSFNWWYFSSLEMLPLRSSFLIITRFYTSSTSTSASAANKSSGFKRISRESFSFRSELQWDELPFIFWTTSSSKVELTILNVKVQHYSVLISSLFKIFNFKVMFWGLCWANARINNFCNKEWWLFRSSQFLV